MKSARLLAVVAAFALAATVAACGSDDEDAGAGDAGASTVEAAFLKAMIPHHESAVEMAETARERAGRTQVERIAGAIIGPQEREIGQMEAIYERLTGEEILPDPNAQADLDPLAKEAGMHHESGAIVLEGARPFDRAFIDEMIPHHQGAIRMAHILMADTDDPELRELGSAIIDAQSREIRKMNSWRKRWYGAKSPAGGVPSVDELPPSGGGDHEGH